MTACAKDRWILTAGCVGLTVLVGLTGCASIDLGSGGSTTTASPRQDPMLENVPLPAGFTMVPERSVVRNDGRLRVAMCEYAGDTAPDRVVAFYKSYMPAAQFVLKQSRLENGLYILRFASDKEECNIRVLRQRNRTHLVVDLGPLPQGAVEHESE